MSWYAVHTRSRHEDRACLGLLQKSFHAFLPKLEVWSKRKDRRKKIMIPMFPGYLFVELPTLNNEIKVDVLKTFGVVRILGKPRGAEPIAVPDDKIDAIRRIVDSKVEVQQFLQKMATAIERGHFEQSGDLRRVFSARLVAVTIISSTIARADVEIRAPAVNVRDRKSVV
jgi:transcription antitermination factor NusG